NRLAFTPDGKRLVVVDKRGVVSVWDMETRRVTTKFRRWPPPDCMAISPDGKHLAWAEMQVTQRTEGGAIVFQPQAGVFRLLDLATGEEKASFTAEKAFPMALAFAEEGKVVVAACFDGNIRRWDPKTAEVIARPFKLPEGRVPPA